MTAASVVHDERYGVVVDGGTALIYDEEEPAAWIESTDHVPIEEVA
jgi:hypothetical protein